MPVSVANTIGDSLSSASLWNEIGTVLPIILPLILFGFGFYLVRRILNSTRKGKPKM